MKYPLSRRPGMADDYQFLVGLAVEDDVSLRVQRHRVRILQVEINFRVSGYIDGAGIPGQHGLHVNKIAVQHGAYDSRPGVGAISRIRGADVNLAIAEHDIIVAAAVESRTESVEVLLMCF